MAVSVLLRETGAEQLFNTIQDLKTKLVNANAYKSELEDALEEIKVLQGQLKQTEDQLSDAEKSFSLTMNITKP
ncbi:MAG: hypothetical protein GQ583_00555 [Methyloprofundus sp.]|nr:hypothetical protein [Methyloprofundus sp.]